MLKETHSKLTFTMTSVCVLGGALIQILTVPQDKGKFQGLNYNKPSIGTVHLIYLFFLILSCILLSFVISTSFLVL